MKNNKHHCDLASCFLCTLCLKEWLPAIDAHRKTINVKKGTVLFNEGDVVTGIYFMYQGMVKVHKKWGSDKELILRLAGKGAIVGHRGLGKVNVYPITATALENSVVCFIDLAFFEATLKVNQDFSYKLMMFFAEELQESEKNMRNLAHMPVKGRVATLLLMLAESFGTTPDGFIDINLSRQDLASYAGTTYETFFRTLNELSEEGSIALDGKNIAVKNKELLIHYTKDGS